MTSLMSIVRILNVIAIILFIISFMLDNALLIYLSIGFLVASIIFWRVKANKSGN